MSRTHKPYSPSGNLVLTARRAWAALVVLLCATSAAAADGWRFGVEASAGLAHELAGIDLTLRYRHVSVYIPFGALGIANLFIDGAPTIAGGIRFFSGDGEGLVLTLQGVGVWTPSSASVEDAGFRGALAATGGWRLRSGNWFAQAAVGPVINYDAAWSWGSLHHRRNWYRDWPVDMDVAIGVEF